MIVIWGWKERREYAAIEADAVYLDQRSFH